jgi:ABC-type thiamine transport system substrate-binding protein
MNTMTLKRLVGVVVLASAGLVLSACNTTKATIDTFAKFTSSTSPGEWIDADGVIQKDK